MSDERLTRWADAADTPVALVEAVHALRVQHGSPNRVDALAARLASELATPTRAESAGGTSGAGAPGRLQGPWLAGLGTALVVAALAAWTVTSDRADRASTEPRARAPERVASPAIAAPPSSEDRSPPRITPESASEPAAASPRVARVPAPRDLHARRDSQGARPAPARVDPESELRLLERAQSWLDREPSRALELASEHARTYPRGVFVEEREVLALEAELKLGRHDAALARAQRFVATYPRSAHARRVRALLQSTAR